MEPVVSFSRIIVAHSDLCSGTCICSYGNGFYFCDMTNTIMIGCQESRTAGSWCNAHFPAYYRSAGLISFLRWPRAVTTL